jgi:hypothetical protein
MRAALGDSALAVTHAVITGVRLVGHTGNRSKLDAVACLDRPVDKSPKIRPITQ